MLVDGVAVAVLDAVDQRRLDLAAAVVEHRVGADHAQQRGLARAQREREIGRQVVIDTEALGVFADQRHADVLRQPHRHHVARLLDAEAQGRGAVELLRVVFRRPDAVAGVDLERRVHHHGRGRIAVVEGSRVDDRLERRSGLAQRLGRAVELTLVIGEAADHREHVAGLRLHHHHRARDLGYLMQAELIVLAGERLDIDHVADVEHLRDLGRGLALERARGGLRPLHALEREGADLALLDDRAGWIPQRLQADARRLIAGLEHHREPPGRDVGKRLDLGEPPTPLS